MSCITADHVLGISYSVRFNGVLISVWNRHGANEKSVQALKDVIMARISVAGAATASFYKKHSEHEGFGEAVAAAADAAGVEK